MKRSSAEKLSKTLNQSRLTFIAPKGSKLNGWQPAFLKREALLSVWDSNAITSEIQTVSNEPCDSWFHIDNPSQIVIGKAYFFNGSLQFSNGRHRTRWMLQQGYENIPVCLRPDSYFEAGLFGLLSRIAFDGETIK